MYSKIKKNILLVLICAILLEISSQDQTTNFDIMNPNIHRFFVESKQVFFFVKNNMIENS